ncbi:DUF5011 domain-containing protein [bacterium]|nr:DUF5011 domain-containing protein [bacterium]
MKYFKALLACLFGFTFATAQAQITLPYTEGFENIGSTTTFTSSTSSINGLSNWSYANTNRGRLRFKAGNGFYHNGVVSATLDASTTNQYSTNYLTLTLDLSKYTKSDLELSFYFMNHGDESNTEDKVYIRGSNSDSWVLIYDWYSHRGTSGRWNYTGKLDIDSALAKANQKVSSTFQLRFGQRDNYPASSLTADDGVTFDDITINEHFKRNATLLDFSSFCSGKSDITATFKNNGTDTIQSARINWWVNGKKMKGASFSGTVLPGSTAQLKLSGAQFVSGSNTLIAIVDSVNGDADQNLHDTLTVSRKTGLSGTYTIGGSSADFSTVQQAVDDLNTRGVCGAVKFTVNAGTYSGALSFQAITGASKTNAITFDGLDSSKAIITYTGGTVQRNTITMTGAEWITFKNLKLQTTASGPGWVAYLAKSCRNIAFENCWFNMPSSGTSQDLIGIVASDATGSESVSGDNVENLTVTGCYFYGGERGISIMGPSGGFSKNIQIANNHFEYQYYTCLGMNNFSAVSINSNKMENLRQTGSIAMLLYTLSNTNITANNIVATYIGIYVRDLNTSGSTWANITNNMIKASNVALYLTNPSYSRIYHNTLLGAPALNISNPSTLDFRNNILYGYGNAAFYCLSSYGFNRIDYNQYYATSTTKITYGLTNYTSLANWKSDYVEFNQNSVEGTPAIISTNDLHLSSSTSSPRAPSLGVLNDIDGDARCFSPSIGADESTYKQGKPKAKFNLPDTSFINAIVLGKNADKAEDLNAYEWYVNNKLVAKSLNLNHKFPKKGRYKVTLKTMNCSAFDTVSHFIVIKALQNATVPRFTAKKTVVQKGERVYLFNKSLNGPDTLIWSVSPDFLNARSRTFTYADGTDSGSYNPVLIFNTSGDYTICLYAGNKLGGSTKCRVNFISVSDEHEICNTGTESTVSSGILRDPGGKGPYLGLRRYNCTFAVLPCAKTLYLKFNEFDLAGGRDYLKVYDGKDNTGGKIYAYNTAYSNGLTGSKSASYFRDSLVARSGKAYFEFTTSSTSISNGFEVQWTAEAMNIPAPVADFDIPDTICVGTELSVENLSTGLGNSYNWQIMSNVTNTISYTDSAITHYFFFSGKYTVRLAAKNCGGTDSVEKQIVVVEAPAKPKAKFEVDIKNPDVGQVVTLSDISHVGGFVCSEYRTWRISPSKYAYVTGYNSQQQITKVVFQDTGCFDIRLIATNTQGIDTILVKCAVHVKKTCIPKVQNLDGDVGISRVVLGKIDNSSASGTTAYTDYRATNRTDLMRGGYYDLKIYRNKPPQNDLNRAAWIDYNQDGDFDDKGEQIAASGSPNKDVYETFKFKVPAGAKLGATTLRIGVSKNNSSNTACGTNVNGEFEDYRVDIIRDSEAPSIFLYGDSVEYVNQCETWNDPMGYGLDNALHDTIKLTVAGSVLFSKAGTYKLVYTAADSSGNSTTAERTVVVAKDTVKPSLTLNGGDTIYVEANSSFTDPGYFYSDNCYVKSNTVTGTINTGILGTQKLTYTVVDSSSNTRQIIRVVIVRDTKAPFVTQFIGGDTIEQQVKDPFTDPGIVFADNYYDNSKITLTKKGSVDVNTPGNYLLWYILKDPSGNIDSFSRLVIVGDFLTPKVEMIGDDYQTIDVFSTYTDEGVTYTDYNGGTTGLTLKVSGSYVDSFGYNKPATRLGVFSLVYTVTNAKGSQTKVTRLIKVVDRVAPILSLKGNNPEKVKLNDSYNEAGWTVVDNYWPAKYIWVYPTGTVNTAVPDTYYVHYYAADSSGNMSSTKTRVVIVEKDISIGGVISNPQIEIYPNPTSGLVVVKNTGSSPVEAIRVYNQQGKLVYNSTGKNALAETTIDLSAYENGVYYINFYLNNAIETRKVVKQE